MAKTVLIVDDNAYIRQALCRVFKCESDFDSAEKPGSGEETPGNARRAAAKEKISRRGIGRLRVVARYLRSVPPSDTLMVL
jgi:hypothetical protein